MIKFYFKPKIRRAPISARRYMSKSRKQALTFKMVCVFLVLLIIFIITDTAIRPAIKENAMFVVKNELTFLINDCVNEYLEKEKITYNDLVILTHNKSGEISSISANTVNVNKVKANITNNISRKLLNSKGEKIKVPSGNLLNSYLFNNKGIKITVKLTGYGYVETDIVSEFKSGGINQTMHKIFINVKVSVNTNVGTLKTTETVETTVLLTETVLVGNVPDMHFNN